MTFIERFSLKDKVGKRMPIEK